MSDLEKLHEAVFTLAGIVIRPENMTEERVVMKQLFESLLGSVVLPEMAKLDPETIDNEEFKRILEEYSLNKVREMMNPTEKEVIKEVIKEVPVEGKKHRRLKSKVDKKLRKKRDLSTRERAYLIKYWNDKQYRVGKDNDVCIQLAKDINENLSSTEEIRIYPLQVAGFYSHLSRMACSTASRRETWWERAIKKGKIDRSITEVPKYSPELVRECQEYYKKERAEEETRKKEHDYMRASRKFTVPFEITFS